MKTTLRQRFHSGSAQREQVIQILVEAGKIMLDRTDLQIHEKSSFDFVTQKDFQVQHFVQQALQQAFPDMAFLGEESREKERITGPTWILDPIDGTTNFIHDRRYSCISLGLTDGKDLLFGVIYDPYSQEIFHALDGETGLLRSPEREIQLQVSEEKQAEKALVLASSGSSDKAMARDQWSLAGRIQQQVVDVRVTGSSSLNLAWIAAGRADLLISNAMNPWDMAAGLVLIRSAGGHVLDYQGRDVPGLVTASIVAGNPSLVAWGLAEISASGILQLPAYLAKYGPIR